MADSIKLSIVTDMGVACERQVSYVNIPAGFGSLGVLSGHAPMLCAVAGGVLRCSFEDGHSEKIKVGSGIANVLHNEVTLLVDRAELIKE